CRRALGDRQEAEAAFQSTFLQLAAGAASIRNRSSVASWLHGVAFRLARRARQRAGQQLSAGPSYPARSAGSEPGAEAAWRELCRALQDELHRLPEKYRAPLLLCYLEGVTHEEAARRLRWPLGTVGGRLARARDLLRRRLTR